MRISKESMLDELVPDDQVKIAQDSGETDRLYREWFDEWVFLNDGSIGLVIGVIDPNTLNVDLYSTGHGGGIETTMGQTTSVPIIDIDRQMTANEINEFLEDE